MSLFKRGSPRTIHFLLKYSNKRRKSMKMGEEVAVVFLERTSCM